MTYRLNKNLLFVGRRGSGKTTIAYKLAVTAGKKIIVIDTDDHPFYREKGFKDITVEDLPKWTSGNVRIITGDPQAALLALNEHCSNANIICEDAAKYIDANVGKKLKRFIIDHRKRNFDVFLMFHFLGDIPPYLAKQYDSMVLFKTGDNLEVSQNKFANWHLIAERANKIKAHSSSNFNMTIRIDE